jgi:hypothetical protein
MGAGLPPRGGSLHPPRSEPRRRRKRWRLGRAQECANALAAAAAETLAEDFVDFLFPVAPDVGEPQA